jgi:hypothetical protein
LTFAMPAASFAFASCIIFIALCGSESRLSAVHVDGERRVAFARETAGHRADVVVEPPPLLDDDDAGQRALRVLRTRRYPLYSPLSPLP